MMSLQVPLKAEMRITVKHPVMETQACTSFAWKSMILVRIAEYVAGPEASPYASHRSDCSCRRCCHTLGSRVQHLPAPEIDLRSRSCAFGA